MGSIRLPAGEITSKTTATSLPSNLEDVIAEDVLVLDVSSAIVQGTNVFAAEVHNSSSGSSDLVFGARVDIAANPSGNGTPNLGDVLHPWIKRQLPEGDWALETEIKLEKVQFGEFYAGLLVEADQGGASFRYGVGFKDGDSIASIRVNPSGTSETMTSVPTLNSDLAVIRLERKGKLLNFYWVNDGGPTQINQVILPEGTTFSTGGIFASTEIEQSLEASFDYAMLIGSEADFTTWMSTNGLANPNDEYENSGLTNLMAYALGRDLNPNVTPALIRNGNLIGFSHRQRIVGGQVRYQVEKSTDLVNWTSAGDLTPEGEAIENQDGTFTVNLLSSITTSDRDKIYFRLVVSAF